MPSYKVKAVGYFGGKLYDPNGKRTVLHTDTPLKPLPSWVEPPEEETAAQRRSRLAAEKKQRDADAEKKQSDDSEIAAVSFVENPKHTVETL